VAGGLALLLSAYPGLSDIAQEHALINGAVDLGTPGTDNDFGNGRLDLLAAYHVAAGGADLAIGKTDAFDPVYTGGTLTYTLLVTNTGPGTATAVTVTDALPLGVTYSGASGDGWICDHSGGILTCTRSSLAVGVAPRIVVAVAVPVSSGTITNTAVVTSTRIDPNPANNTDAEQTRVDYTRCRTGQPVHRHGRSPRPGECWRNVDVHTDGEQQRPLHGHGGHGDRYAAARGDVRWRLGRWMDLRRR